MRNLLGKLLVSTALLGLTLLPLRGFAQPKASQQSTTPANPQASANRKGGGGGERHPQVRAALGALQNAKRHLEEGAHDFQGHRAKALEHTEAAIQECQEALKADKD